MEGPKALGDRSEDPLFTSVIAEMKRPARDGRASHAMQLVQRLDLVDLSRLHDRGDVLRGVVADLAASSAELDQAGGVRPKPGHERRFEVLVELGRISLKRRERAIADWWLELGLSERQKRLLEYMPGHRRHQRGWLEQVFAVLRRAPYFDAPVEAAYRDNQPVKVIVVEAGKSKPKVEVEMTIVLDVPPTDDELAVVSEDKVLEVEICLLAKRECTWTCSDTVGSQSLAIARAERRGSSLTCT